jgi:hypothetical protein
MNKDEADYALVLLRFVARNEEAMWALSQDDIDGEVFVAAEIERFVREHEYS